MEPRFLLLKCKFNRLTAGSKKSHKYLPVDFAKLAEAFGATGIRVEKIEDVRPALEQAKEIEDGPVVIDFIVAEEENVFPIVPGGQGLGDLVRNEEDARKGLSGWIRGLA